MRFARSGQRGRPGRAISYPGGVSGWFLLVVVLATAVVIVAAVVLVGLVASASGRRAGAAAGGAGGLGRLRGRHRQGRAAPASSSPEEGMPGLVTLLEALPQTAVVLDGDDEVLRASTAAYTYNLLDGDAVREPRLARMVERVRVTGQPQDADLEVARGRVSGTGVFHLRVRAAAIGAGRVLILVDDRTAARRVEDMRRDFVVNISHELKTPVGAIALLAETIEDSAQDPEVVRHFAPRLRKEAERLGTLVQEVIELSRLQEGDALEAPEDVDVDAVVSESLDRVRTAAEAAGITLVIGGVRGLSVRGDAGLIATAVRNLLENAIRYSEPGTRVSVGVSLGRSPDSSAQAASERASGQPVSEPDLVRIAVVDQGIGIAKEDQERVFERFYRVDKARSRATGGTGLGLSIVKHVAADHGGTVELWSALGRGSTFTLVLPRSGQAAAQGTGKVRSAG